MNVPGVSCMKQKAYLVLRRQLIWDDTFPGQLDELVADQAQAKAYLETAEDVEAVRNEDMHARQLGIEGVPCFIVNNRYALSGAQEPEAFFSLFDMVEEELRQAAL